jgi:SAM-dependent methyltransferase
MDTQSHYNKIYANANCFAYSERLYDAYIGALVRKSGLRRGARVLDAPCGQGFFSYLFHKQGMKVRGADISPVGVAQAKETYSSLDIEFQVADIRALPFTEQFDCIYTRSCSLYNSADFATDSDMTRQLLRHLKPGGLFLFAYNTTAGGAAGPSGWINHTVNDVKRHFAAFREHHPRFYLINKMDTYLLGRFAFTPGIAKMNEYLLPMLKRNGDVLCVFRKNGTEED